VSGRSSPNASPADGTYQTVDDPNGIGTTTINGINDKGQLVGFYVDGNDTTIGFVANAPEPGSGFLTLFGVMLAVVLKLRTRGASPASDACKPL
jgi:hypothetical protein